MEGLEGGVSGISLWFSLVVIDDAVDVDLGWVWRFFPSVGDDSFCNLFDPFVIGGVGGMGSVYQSVVVNYVILEWSTALDDGVGYEWGRHSIVAIGDHYELIYFVYDWDEIWLHIFVMFVVDEVGGTSGGESMEVPGLDAAGWDGHEAWLGTKPF